MYLIDCAAVGLGILKRLDCAVHSNDRGILESDLVGLLVTDRNNISEQRLDREHAVSLHSFDL